MIAWTEYVQWVLGGNVREAPESVRGDLLEDAMIEISFD